MDTDEIKDANRATAGRPLASAGQSAGGAYPNNAGGGTSGGQSGQAYHGGGQLGPEGDAPNAVSKRGDDAQTRETEDDNGPI